MENFSDEPKTIRVIDRRRFDEEGTEREGVEDHVAAMPEPTPPPAAAPKTPPPPPAPATAPAQRTAPPPQPSTAAEPRTPRHAGAGRVLDFGHFCLSLANSAQIAMGLVPNPATRMITKDLGSAQQTIEILGMLQQKTQGNLTPEETQIITEILYALRMQFVELTKGPAIPNAPAAAK